MVEAHTAVIAANTAAMLLAASDDYRDVTISVSTTGGGIGPRSMSNVAVGAVMQDTTIRITWPPGAQLWARSAGSSTTWSVLAVPISPLFALGR